MPITEEDNEKCVNEISDDLDQRCQSSITDGKSENQHNCVNWKNFGRRLSRRLSNVSTNGLSSVKDIWPETKIGWTILVSALTSLSLSYELNLQKSLTMPPMVFGQRSTPTMKYIYEQLTETPSSILCRTIQPSLFVGTRSVLASTAAYLSIAPKKLSFVTFREVLIMPHDGAHIALDWELPPSSNPAMDRDAAQKGPLQKHVVVILHGINNDANFGYVRSLMRACTERGWAAVGFNFRGCGNVPLNTPRGYTGAYTGDIRGTVQTLSGRLHPDFKLFLVGNSLGANLITKYLGEEGLGGTLPSCVAGGVSLGNPLSLHDGKMQFPWGHILSLGARKTILQQFCRLRKMTSSQFQDRIRMALMASTIDKFDEALAPIYVRNNPNYPYEQKIGYKSAEEYWHDGSSYRFVAHISVPFLLLSSDDDFLVSKSSSKKLHCSLSNPNVLVVNTRCGGHLGWQECPPDNRFQLGKSWADIATVDFIASVLDSNTKLWSPKTNERGGELQLQETREQMYPIQSKL